jgi:hypothetical protein
VSLLDKAAKKLALRWLRGKADKARKEGSGIMKAADGNKRLLFVLGFIVAQCVALATGQDVTHILGGLMQALGWSDAAMVASAQQVACVWAPLIFAFVAAGHAIWKQWRKATK